MAMSEQSNVQSGPLNDTIASTLGADELERGRTVFNKEVLAHWSTTRDAQISLASQESITTASKIEAPRDVGVVRQPPVPMRFPREIVLQEWEGQVQEVTGRLFSARLVDLTSKESEETEEVDLPLDDLSEGDQALITP